MGKSAKIRHRRRRRHERRWTPVTAAEFAKVLAAIFDEMPDYEPPPYAEYFIVRPHE